MLNEASEKLTVKISFAVGYDHVLSDIYSL
jgi:hypothetical protein